MTKRILHRCNSISAVMQGMKEFDGVEVDVRRLGSKLVLAHEESDSDGGPYLVAVLRLAQSEFPNKTLALNVKEHGLSELLANTLTTLSSDYDYFVFDVPGVELPRYHGLGIRTFARISYCEVQRTMPGGGALVDPFRESDQPHLLKSLLMSPAAGAPVAMISNGCHGRLDERNVTKGVSYLIGKASELTDLEQQQ